MFENFKQNTVDFLTERLKFPFYSREEAEQTMQVQTSQTAKPEQIESSYATYDPFSSYTSSQFGQQTVLAANKNELIRKWRESSYLPEVDTALEEIANEAIVFDEIEDVIALNLQDIELPETIKDKMEESFEKIMYLLDFNGRGDEIFKQWFIDGTLNCESVYSNDRIREGIQKIQLLSPFNFHQFVDQSTGQKKYYYGDSTANALQLKAKDMAAVFFDEQITSINSGQASMDRKFYVSHLNKAMKAINQLGLIEDALVIYRITRSPEKRAFYVATGNLPKPKAEEYMRSLIQKYRQKKVYNTELGTIENRNRSISILEDFWFPVGKDGQGTKVESIAGQSPNFTSFEDVDYFLNKVYKALNLPQNRRNPEARNTQGNTIDIEKDELKFFKFILKLRRRFNNLFVDLMKKDLLAQNVMSISDWNMVQEKIKFTYANSNEYSEIKNNQIVSMRVDAANGATALIDAGILSPEYIQENILRLTEEEILKIKQQNAARADSAEMSDSEFGPDYDVQRRPSGGGGGGMHAGPRPMHGTPPKGSPDGIETATPPSGAPTSTTHSSTGSKVPEAPKP